MASATMNPLKIFFFEYLDLIDLGCEDLENLRYLLKNTSFKGPINYNKVTTSN